MRGGGVGCRGGGAGLIRADLRDARGSDVIARSGGLVVAVRGRRARTVPVLPRYHARLRASARPAGSGLICGGGAPPPPEHPPPPSPPPPGPRAPPPPPPPPPRP